MNSSGINGNRCTCMLKKQQIEFISTWECKARSPRGHDARRTWRISRGSAGRDWVKPSIFLLLTETYMWIWGFRQKRRCHLEWEIQEQAYNFLIMHQWIALVRWVIRLAVRSDGKLAFKGNNFWCDFQGLCILGRPSGKCPCSSLAMLPGCWG